MPIFSRLFSQTALLALLVAGGIARAAAVDKTTEVPDFAEVYRLLDEKCIECHTADDPEANLVLETYEGLIKGGETGKAVDPGKSGESLLMKYVRGEVVKDGKKKIMPPGKREKLAPDEIQTLARWIDAGCKPGAALVKKEISVPKIAPKVPVRASVTALAVSPAASPSSSQKLIAVGRYQTVELMDAATRAVVRKLEGHKGAVNALVFSPDGATLFAAGGENALTGEIKAWSVADGKALRTIEGHRDTIYALALSPDGKVLASGSYDQQIKLWDAATGAELKTLRGHNGAVFGLAFRPDGKILASASADRTIKLWDLATGQRRDTFSQPTKEQAAIAWSPDGKRVAAAGFDNRIRVWEVTPEAKETSNPLLIARYAHEQPITRLVWAGETLATGSQDGTVKLWEAASIKERAIIDKQPEWPSALTLSDNALIAGRIDGSLGCYAIADGKEIAAAAAAPAAAPPIAPKPAKVARLAPRGIQRGGTREVRVIGQNLAGLKFVAANDPSVRIVFSDGDSPTQARLSITTPDSLPRSSVEIGFVGADAKSAGTLKLYVDDLPTTTVAENKKRSAVTPAAEGTATELKFPVSVWSTLEQPGDSDRFDFDAKAGQTLVFDLASKSVGSKADVLLAIVDREGHVLASNNDFDTTGDPLVSYTFQTAGRYTAVVSELQMAGSAEHFYRLSAGELPFVTAVFPLSVPANAETDVMLIGTHLPAEHSVKVTAGATGEVTIPLPAQLRSRRAFKVLVSELPVVKEQEPNDDLQHATALQGPATASGTISLAGDVDMFKFHAAQGSKWAIETQAAQRGSPVDTRIEVLGTDGRKVPRVLLQAVRDSAITFRPIDSVSPDVRVDNWREMELNQWMYMNGEIAKIFRMPEGPDSGFQYYQVNGKRAAYFDTTPTAHSLDEPCYIVEPHAPGTALVSNGLPNFTLYYENDDDAERELGTDSRVLFTAPVEGDYLVRVTDSRGSGGDRNVYSLAVREAKPDFTVALAGGTPSVGARSGQEFTLTANRKDGFDEPITVQITGLPEGYKVTSPLVIESGHTQARGSINALPSAAQLDDAQWAKVKVAATASTLTHDVNGFTKVTLGKDPQVWVALEPAAPGDTLEKLSPPTPISDQDASRPFEITIAPGEIIPAWVKIRRNGAKTEIRFDVQNLPHGVIVDNLGLNGITLLPEQNEGEIQIKADPWVQEMDRLIFAKTRGFGDQTSLPVLLHVRKKGVAPRAVTVK